MNGNPNNPAWIEKVKAMIGIGQAELVDDWLKRHRGAGTVCHTKEATVYLPVKVKEAREAMEKLKRVMTDVFEGVTVWEGNGAFCDRFEEAPGEPRRCVRMTEEPVAILQSFHSCTDDRLRERFAQALKEVEEATGQTYVGIKATNAFYAIPVKELKPW